MLAFDRRCKAVYVRMQLAASMGAGAALVLLS